ncbi:MAG: hypothetical protein CVT98_09215 [Bacteroidetes bacterium HGW-Bacteroidetes-15]|nr:MAG: hypothetical protein CVT98_09215 [Bacteroidetes bacterium HGW-Bacteroidetes-15]
MENITSTTDLKNAILLLEAEQRAKGLELKDEYAEAYKSINPINLIKETLHGDNSSPGILENIIIGGVGLATGYITRRLFVGPSANIFRKLIGSALQFGTTSLIAKNGQTIKSLGQLLFDLYSSKKKKANRKQH